MRNGMGMGMNLKLKSNKWICKNCQLKLKDQWWN